MEKAEIAHLGELARIELTDAELSQLEAEIPAILEYVGTINEIVADDVTTKQVGARYNVLRPDEVGNAPESFTKEFLAEAPETDGRHVKVKKILHHD